MSAQRSVSGVTAGPRDASAAFVVNVRADGAVRFPVRVQPRASCGAIEGVHGGALKVRLSAPPADGAANEALVELLAEALGVPRRAVRVVAGAASRSKVVEVEGASEARVRSLASRP
jgi:uncharacterized protein (TIGR00251 family)